MSGLAWEYATADGSLGTADLGNEAGRMGFGQIRLTIAAGLNGPKGLTSGSRRVSPRLRRWPCMPEAGCSVEGRLATARTPP